MTLNELKMLQALPLEVKIIKSKKRIAEWIEEYGAEKVYLSFSGGLGSTVLLWLVNEVCIENGYPVIPALFVNTRNEYPEVVRHVYRVKGANNDKYRKIVKEPYTDSHLFADQVEVRLPKVFLADVIKKSGYLIASKKTSRCIHDARQIVAKRPDDYYLDEKFVSLMDTRNKFSIPKKYRKFIFGDIEVSSKCCHELKHSVIESYQKESGRIYAMTGEQAEESKLRQGVYLKHGCNGYDMKSPKSTPLGFWTSSDLCEYVRTYHVPYPTCYGEVVCRDGKYVTTEEERTGCLVCTAGAGKKQESGTMNRFQRMAVKHPIHYKMMLKPLSEGGYGMAKVLDEMKVPYEPEVEEIPLDELFDMLRIS